MAKEGLHLVENQDADTTEQPKQECVESEENKQKHRNGRKESVRTKVKNAQIKVLDSINEIVGSNCKAAVDGNPSCAKFMLDWSGISDLRSPLAKPIKRKSLADGILKKLKNSSKKSKIRRQKGSGKRTFEGSPAR